MIWYLQDLQRFREERESLERLASNSDWLKVGEWHLDASLRLVWDADIVVGERIYPITLQYPNHFPHSPALVRPRGAAERWTSHQYGAGGELCLEFGPDNWHSDLTGANMIESAHRLLAGENPSPGHQGVVASRHATTAGQNLRGRYLRLLVTSALDKAVATLPERTPVSGKLVSLYHEEAVVFAISSLVLPDGSKWTDESIPTPIKYEGHERDIQIIRWPTELDTPSVQSAKALRTIVNVGETAQEVPFLCFVRGPTIHAYRLWDDDSISEIASVLPQPPAARVDDAHASLADRHVAIVGCGSLGSKVAVMLARAGVGRFFLVDDDVMLPENLIRHDVDWRDLGVHKADAVARRIQLVNPAAKCTPRRDRVGGQESSGSIETLIGSLAECDLVVDATADDHAFGYLCAAASAGKKPVVWAEVFGGGFGGLIARHRPGLEPDPASMRRAIEQWCVERGVPAPRTANYETREGGTPLIADDADVTVIAAHAARLTIDTLIPRSPSLFPNSVYMIGLAQEWIFDQPFDTRPIDFGVPVAPPTPEAVDEQTRAQEMALIGDLFRKYANAAAADTTDHSTPAT